MKTIELGLSKEVSKAYTEGIYADTPSNRKLGRVGMTYTAYAEKIEKEKEGKEDKKEGDIENISINRKIRDLFNKTFFDLLEIANYETGTKAIKKLDTWKVEGKTIGEKIKNLPDNYFKQVFDIIAKGKYTSDPNSIYSNFKKKLKEIQTRENKGKTWDKQEDFFKEGSDEKKLWDSWYKFQKSGDPSNISSMRMILEKKFPNVEKWKQTTPNTGKAQLSAIVKDKEIAKIDLSGDKIDLTKLQTFMDKCYDI